MKKEPHWAARLGCPCCCPWWGVCLWVSGDHSSFLSGDSVSWPLMRRRSRPPKYLGSTLVLEFGHYSFCPSNQNQSVFFPHLDASWVSGCILSSHLKCISRYLEAWERRPVISFYVALACKVLPFSLQWIVLVFKDFFFCLLNRNIFSFSLKKKIGIWSTFPLPSWLLILPSCMSTAPHGHGSPWPHAPTKLFCFLAFLWTDLKLLLLWFSPN